MLTLYHAPNSRSSRIVHIAEELGLELDIRLVDIARNDGSGGADPANPHPEGKVPLLVHDGTVVRETAAIVLYLTDLAPASPLGVPAGDPRRGAYLSWLFWYGNVLEPVTIFAWLGLSDPVLEATFRDAATAALRISEALRLSPYLMGEGYTAADLMVASPFLWFPQLTPDDPEIHDWLARCAERPARTRATQRDAAWRPAA